MIKPRHLPLMRALKPCILLADADNKFFGLVRLPHLGLPMGKLPQIRVFEQVRYLLMYFVWKSLISLFAMRFNVCLPCSGS